MPGILVISGCPKFSEVQRILNDPRWLRKEREIVDCGSRWLLKSTRALKHGPGTGLEAEPLVPPHAGQTLRLRLRLVGAVCRDVYVQGAVTEPSCQCRHSRGKLPSLRRLRADAIRTYRAVTD